MSVTFIHTADLHLGSRLKTVGSDSERIQDKLRDATYDAFEGIIDSAIEHEVDFVTVAGDLYDQESRSVWANKFLKKQFERLQDHDIDAFIIHGNHDPAGGAKVHHKLPDNVHEFDYNEAENHVFMKDGEPAAEIIGQSYRKRHGKKEMVENYQSENKDLPTIAILHTGLDKEERYVPCTFKELSQRESIDYWALGHIHKTEVFGNNKAAYPGIPQGRDIGEKGVGGCFLVEVEKNDEPDLEFIPVGEIVWNEETVSIEEDNPEDLTELRHIIEGKAEEIEYSFQPKVKFSDSDWQPEGYILRFILEGHGSAHKLLKADDALPAMKQELRNNLKNGSPFIWTEKLKDRTKPEMEDIEELRGSNEIIDHFFQIMQEMEENGSKPELEFKPKSIWRETEDSSELDSDKLALTEEKKQELFEIAKNRVMNELVKRQ